MIASTLLGVDPPRLPALALVRSGELFGLSEGATRTALSRMTSAGELEAADGSYRLAGRLLERHARQREAREAGAAPWDGTWEVHLVVVERRSAGERARLRDAARRLRLAEVREGCWARPANLDPSRAPAARAIVDAQCTTLRGGRPDDPVALVAAFEPEAWATAARSLADAMAAAQPALDRLDTDALADTFVLDAAVVRHLLADPVLPHELAPEGWPAPALREAFDRFDAGFKATWRAWYRGFRTDRPGP
ncbi:MAG TPA: PaaX family transcriptional regulator C-terminal domain-containing protein [Acidimicrobiales bacterium]|nr:PaaX family transcriptional regulator C-terminal domain-containing protein [Acidimicrobiales bacterium]